MQGTAEEVSAKRTSGLVAKTVAAVVTIFLLSGCIVSVFTYSNTDDSGTDSSALEQLEAVAHREYPLNFLVVGDWGREGAYNQTLVAKQVPKHNYNAIKVEDTKTVFLQTPIIDSNSPIHTTSHFE